MSYFSLELMDKDRKRELYDRYLEIGIHESLRQILGQTNKFVPNVLQYLLPINHVWGFYPYREVSWKHPISEEVHTEYFKGKDDRINAYNKINSMIREFNLEVEKFSFDQIDSKKSFPNQEFWVYGLNVRTATRKIPISKEDRTNFRNDEVIGICSFDNETIYKIAMDMETSEGFVPSFNKMVYEYLLILKPNRDSNEHILNKPIVEFENWFMENGLSIEITPNLLDLKGGEGGEDVKNPIAMKLEEVEKENKELKHTDYVKTQKIILKAKRHKRELALANKESPRSRFENLIKNNLLDKHINENRYFHKSSGKLNKQKLAESIGLSDGKTIVRWIENEPRVQYLLTLDNWNSPNVTKDYIYENEQQKLINQTMYNVEYEGSHSNEILNIEQINKVKEVGRKKIKEVKQMPINKNRRNA